MTENLNTLAKIYKILQSQLKELEDEIIPYKEKLELAALEAGGKLNLDEFKVSLVEAERDIFMLKEAKLRLPMPILSPFIKKISYTQLRVLSK